jgi:hypothetical protein
MYACINLQHGRFVSPALRRLVCYAVFGHPVDAYKFYEYNYQQEYMPHRYLPEHVVLGEIPKPVDYREPAPSSIHGFKKHRDIRYHMAQAKDQGVGELGAPTACYQLRCDPASTKRFARRVHTSLCCAVNVFEACFVLRSHRSWQDAVTSTLVTNFF